MDHPEHVLGSMEHVLSSMEHALLCIRGFKVGAGEALKAFPAVLTVRSQSGHSQVTVRSTVRSQSGHVFCGHFANFNKIFSFYIINRLQWLPLDFQIMRKKP